MTDHDPTKKNPNAKRSEESKKDMKSEEEIYTERDSLNEIRRWMLGEGGGRESMARPLWQQEALQRLYERGSLGGGNDGGTSRSSGGNEAASSMEENLREDWRELLEIIKSNSKSKILRDEKGQIRLTLGQTPPQQLPPEQSRDQNFQGEKSIQQIAKTQAADKPQDIVLKEIADVRGVNALVGGQCLSFVNDDKQGSGGKEKSNDGGNNSPSLKELSLRRLPLGGLALLYGDNGSGKSSYARILANACHARRAEEILSNLKVGAGAEEKGDGDGQDAARGNAYPSAVLKYWAYDRAGGGKAVGEKEVRWWYVNGKSFFQDFSKNSSGENSSSKGWGTSGSPDLLSPENSPNKAGGNSLSSGGQSDPAPPPLEDKASKAIAKQLEAVRVFSDATASVHSEANKAIYTPYPKLLLDQLANACTVMNRILNGEIDKVSFNIEWCGGKGSDFVRDMSNDFDNEVATTRDDNKFEIIDDNEGNYFLTVGSENSRLREIDKSDERKSFEELYSDFSEKGDEVSVMLWYLSSFFEFGRRSLHKERFFILPIFNKLTKWKINKIEQWLDELSHFSERDEKELQEVEQWIVKQNENDLIDWVDYLKKQKGYVTFDELRPKIKEIQSKKKMSKEYWQKVARCNRLRSRRWLVAGEMGDGKKGTPGKENFLEAINFLRKMGWNIEEKKRLEKVKIGQFEGATLREKGEEEAAKLVGPRWKKNFKRELEQLGLGHLGLEVRSILGKEGETHYQIGFSDDSLGKNKLDRVLSSGEFRCVALAAFLAEDVTEGNRSAIIFDDPVSSLDHNYRSKIARRLATLSKERQVIVFTHDLMFLWLLQNAIDEQKELGQSGWVHPCTISRARDFDGRDLIGFCGVGLPFGKKRVKPALNVFGEKLEKLIEVEEERAKQIDLSKKNLPSAEGETDWHDEDKWFIEKMGYCVTFRHLCERTIEEVIGVFERLDDKIHMRGLASVVPVTLKHYDGMYGLFDECSKIVHYFPKSQAALPSASELSSDFAVLAKWREEVQRVQDDLEKYDSAVPVPKRHYEEFVDLLVRYWRSVQSDEGDDLQKEKRLPSVGEILEDLEKLKAWRKEILSQGS